MASAFKLIVKGYVLILMFWLSVKRVFNYFLLAGGTGLLVTSVFVGQSALNGNALLKALLLCSEIRHTVATKGGVVVDEWVALRLEIVLKGLDCHHIAGAKVNVVTLSLDCLCSRLEMFDDGAQLTVDARNLNVLLELVQGGCDGPECLGESNGYGVGGEVLSEKVEGLLPNHNLVVASAELGLLHPHGELKINLINGSLIAGTLLSSTESVLDVLEGQGWGGQNTKDV